MRKGVEAQPPLRIRASTRVPFGFSVSGRPSIASVRISCLRPSPFNRLWPSGLVSVHPPPFQRSTFGAKLCKSPVGEGDRHNRPQVIEDSNRRIARSCPLGHPFDARSNQIDLQYSPWAPAVMAAATRMRRWKCRRRKMVTSNHQPLRQLCLNRCVMSDLFSSQKKGSKIRYPEILCKKFASFAVLIL